MIGQPPLPIYTIVQTAKLNGVNPEAYLKDTLTKIAAGHPINKILQLMPWQMLPPAAANLRSRNLRFRSTQKAGGRCSFALHAADEAYREHGTVLLVRCSALIIFGHVAPNIRHHSQLIERWSDRSEAVPLMRSINHFRSPFFSPRWPRSLWRFQVGDDNARTTSAGRYGLLRIASPSVLVKPDCGTWPDA